MFAIQQIDLLESHNIDTPPSLHGLVLEWHTVKGSVLPEKWRGETVKAKTYTFSPQDFRPRINFPFNIKQINIDNYDQAVRKGLWRDIHEPLIHDQASRLYYAREKEGEELTEEEKRIRYAQSWQEAFRQLYDHSIEHKGQIPVVYTSLFDARVGEVKAWELGRYEKDDPRRFQAAVLGLEAIRTAKHLCECANDYEANIIIAPDLISVPTTSIKRKIRGTNSETGKAINCRYIEILDIGGTYLDQEKIIYVFPWIEGEKIRPLSRPDLNNHDWSLTRAIAHEIAHKIHMTIRGDQRECLSRIVKEGFAQVCESEVLQEGDRVIHAQVGSIENADIYRIASLIGKQFDGVRDEETSMLSEDDNYFVPHSLFWLIYRLGNDDNIRADRFSQFIRLLSGYDVLDSHGQYLRVVVGKDWRKVQEERYGPLKFVGGDLAACVKAVYGLRLEDMDKAWKEAVRDALPND